MYLTRRQTVSRCVAHRRFGGGAAIVALAAAWSAGALAQDLPPTYGTRTLSTSEAGRVSLDLQAGGNLSAQQYLGPACVGMVAEAPDFRINLQGSGTADLDVRVQSVADTTLIVYTPDDEWLCNDDWNGLNPGVEILSAEPGEYDIWVGTFESSGLPSARLTVAARPVSGASGAPAASAPEAPAEWWYASGGDRAGPVTLEALEEAIDDGAIDRDTLVWRDGMAQWQAAGSVDDVSALFPVEPPPLPATEAPTPPPLPGEEDAASPPPLPEDPTADDDTAPTGATAPDTAPSEEDQPPADPTTAVDESDADQSIEEDGGEAEAPAQDAPPPQKPATTAN